MTDQPGPDAPQQLSYYRLGRMLGSGGCGVVYEATDVRFNTRVAVKLLHAHLTDDEAYRERFLRETHVASLLRSPYTVQVHQSGVEDGRYFLVMELIDGGSVADVLRSGPLEPGRALRIAAHVARSLEEAELRGITHRDIKPENVMLTADGTAQVVDFGVARQAGAGTLTGTGEFVGTPVYAAPETALGRADHRSDVYSLGVTLYHMLTGRPPFSGEPLEVLLHHERTAPPTEPLAGLPRAVVEAVERCLAKDPAGRYQTAAELAGALEHLAIEGADRDDRALDLAPTRAAEPPAAADGPRRQALAARGRVGVMDGPPIHYARTSDGLNIAYYTLGQGPASVVMPYVPFSHLHAEWRMSEVRELYERLAQDRTVVRYDNRGSGLSDRDISDFSLGAMVRDLEAVVDDLGLDTFALLGTFISGPVSVAYAAQHAERVSHLVLWCTAPPRPARPLPPGAQAVLGALEGDWDVGTETLAHVVMGWSKSGRRLAEFVREATTPETMTEALTLLMGIDLAQVLPEVQAPTLVAHRAAFGVTTIRTPREMAASIPNARLALFDGESVFPDDAVLGAIAEFLAEDD